MLTYQEHGFPRHPADGQKEPGLFHFVVIPGVQRVVTPEIANFNQVSLTDQAVSEKERGVSLSFKVGREDYYYYSHVYKLLNMQILRKLNFTALC